MASDATIVEVPKPPAGRLSFLALLARVVTNPVGSWGRDFYSEPIVVYDDFGLQTVFVMDPELIQAILLDDVESFSKSPIYDRVLGEGGGEGVLIADVLPDDLVIDNVLTFMLAGHETTAQALTWTLYLLALFPEWQEKVREEVRRLAGDRPIGREHIQQLSTVEAIFSEAMRFYPPAPSLMRRATTQIELGGHGIRPGAIIIIPIYVVQRHERLWSEPLRFDPARFSSEAKSGRHRCAYMPFGGGPRTCIGNTFAMFEGKAMLATPLARARFELPKAELPELLARITLRPKAGLKLKVTMLR
jgi:cytochrome P450